MSARSAALTMVALPYINLLIEYIVEWLKRMWQVSGTGRRAPSVAAAGVVEAAG